MAKPKLALIPAAQGSKLFSVLPSSGVGDFDFTRSGSATRINSQGLIETVANGQSRLNYPMIDGKVVGCPHHILEPQRTNLITYSEDFTQGWTEANSTVTSNQVISPDGTQNADLITNTSTNGYVAYTASFDANLEYTFSVFVKAGTSNLFSLVYTPFMSQVISVEFDLSSETATVNTGTPTNFGIDNFGNGWFRIFITEPKNATTGTSFVRVVLSGSTSDTGYIWGAQLEESSYATSYIPTNGSTVTRSAETANGAGDATTFNDSEGVLMTEISALADDGTFRTIAINGTATNVNTNRVQIYFRNTADIITFGMESENSAQFFLQFPLDVKSNNKLALKYSATICSFWINGIKVGEETNKVMPTALSRLDFVRQDGDDEFFYGNTKQVQYYNSALTDSELEELTSWESFILMANGQNYTIE